MRRTALQKPLAAPQLCAYEPLIATAASPAFALVSGSMLKKRLQLYSRSSRCARIWVLGAPEHSCQSTRGTTRVASKGRGLEGHITYSRAACVPCTCTCTNSLFSHHFALVSLFHPSGDSTGESEPRSVVGIPRARPRGRAFGSRTPFLFAPQPCVASGTATA